MCSGKYVTEWITIFSFMMIQDVWPVSVPEQIHISFGDDHHSMVVMWASRDPANGTVWYGTSADMTSSAGSAVARLPEDAYRACRFIHRAQLKGLRPDTWYFYTVMSATPNNTADYSQSQAYSFKTTAHIQTGVRRYLVYGDMGAGRHIPTFAALRSRVRSQTYTAVWHIGDIGYNLDSHNGKVGDEFLRRIQPVAAYVPYMTSPGNHEIADDFAHYRTRFSSPRTAWPIPLTKLWYSYDVGLVHFISYSTEVFFTNNGDNACQQFYWLLQDLISANENRKERPWIIAVGHRPMYCSNNNGDDCTGRFLNRWVKHGLEDLFYAQGVDLIIEAHEHSYERLWPTYDGHVHQYGYDNPAAPVHVVSGAAGSEEGINWMESIDHIWSAFRADNRSLYTFGELEVHNETHIYFAQQEVTKDEELDSFWLIQNHHGPFIPQVSCSGVGQKKHFSCTCPSPFRYMDYIIALSCCAIVLLLLATACFGVKQYRKRKQLKTAQDKTQLTEKDAHRRSICEEELTDSVHDDKSLLLPL